MAKTQSPNPAKPAVAKTVDKPKEAERENPAGNPTITGNEPAIPAPASAEGNTLPGENEKLNSASVNSATEKEEKAAAAEIRKSNLAAANKKRAEEKAAKKLLAEENDSEEVSNTESEEIPVASKDFESILADIKDGKEVTIEDEKGVYFRFEAGRLKKFSKQGGFMDSYPLYALQNRKGWALKK